MRKIGLNLCCAFERIISDVRFRRLAGNEANERAVAVIFGMAESTLHGITERVAGFLESISKVVMRFPNSEEKAACSTKFENSAALHTFVFIIHPQAECVLTLEM